MPNDQAVLLLSFIGYKTEEVPVNGQTNLRITLGEEDNQLTEVVVTA